jgi:hypothetical protein
MLKQRRTRLLEDIAMNTMHRVEGPPRSPLRRPER